jgi:UPF0042 nucleotide-binding protein
VLNHEATEDFISGFISLFNFASAGFLREGKRYITVAFGCTGGRHRSVAVAHEVARRCQEVGIDVHLQDRDVDR